MNSSLQQSMLLQTVFFKVPPRVDSGVGAYHELKPTAEHATADSVRLPPRLTMVWDSEEAGIFNLAQLQC